MGQRSGERWSTQEYHQLVRELVEQKDLNDIAVAQGRTPNAIRAAAARMIPAEEGVRRADVVGWLVPRLAEGYDWETVLRARLREDGTAYWSADDYAALAEAWAASCPLSELARRFDCGERAIVHQLISLELATDLVSVVERLGAQPGGAVELQYKLATDVTGVGLHVLVARQRDGKLHVSVHTSPTAAEETRQRVQPETDGDLPWVIAERTPRALSGPMRGNASSAALAAVLAQQPAHGPQTV